MELHKDAKKNGSVIWDTSVQFGDLRTEVVLWHYGGDKCQWLYSGKWHTVISQNEAVQVSRGLCMLFSIYESIYIPTSICVPELWLYNGLGE